MTDLSYYRNMEPLFGDWTIVRKIGEGSFGKVFEIKREDFGHAYHAAVKIARVPRSEDEFRNMQSEGMSTEDVRSYYYGIIRDMVDEFHLMSRLKGNSNIVSYEDHKVVPRADGFGWDILIRMELLTPIRDHVAKVGMTRRDVAKLGIDLCRALESCAQENIIHRDIKLENIFIAKNGNFKLGDFGIAKIVEQSDFAISQKGTQSYMAPEVYRGAAYNASVDIYSLGLVLFRLLNNNREPFLPPTGEQQITDRETAFRRRMSGVEIPHPFHADQAMGDIILKACAYRPQERFASPTEMRIALENILNLQDGEERLRYNRDRDPNDTSDMWKKYRGEKYSDDYKPPLPPVPPRPYPNPIPNPPPDPYPQPTPPQPGSTPRRGWVVAAIIAAVAVIVIGCVGFISSSGLSDIFSGSGERTEETGKDGETGEDPGETGKDDGGTGTEDPGQTPAQPPDAAPDDGEEPDQSGEGEGEGNDAPAELVWSNWALTLPDYVFDGGYVIETRLQYRQAKRQDYFVSRVEDIPDEYTVCYFTYDDWTAEWTPWDTTPVSPSDLVRVETGTRYCYQTYRYRPTVTIGQDERIDTGKIYSDNVKLTESRTCVYLPQRDQTIYRCKTRSRIYACVIDSDWSQFGDAVLRPVSGTAVNIRTMYRYAKIVGEAPDASMDNFPKNIQPYTSRFVDVRDNTWYGAANGNWAGIAFHLGAMTTDDYLNFRPEENITVAELIRAAVVIRKIYQGENVVLPSASPWYGPYVDYALETGIIEAGVFSDYERAATRADAAYVMGRCLPETEYAKRNTVRAIADVSAESRYFGCIWRLAESGVIEWTDPEGSFHPDGYITRAEVAAMLGRLAYPDKRCS